MPGADIAYSWLWECLSPSTQLLIRWLLGSKYWTSFKYIDVVEKQDGWVRKIKFPSGSIPSGRCNENIRQFSIEWYCGWRNNFLITNGAWAGEILLIGRCRNCRRN
jgi:hypothetical protein